MNRKKQRFLFFPILLIFLTLVSSNGFASEFNFAVTPIPSEKQVDKEKTYFDLLLAPNEETELKVNLRNDTDKEVKVGISINSAITNSNVIVEYGENKGEKDQSLAFDIKDYVQYPSSVRLKPKSEQTVSINVKMPNTPFDGVLASGITFKEETSDEGKRQDDKSQGLSIKNEYSYVVALLMQQNKKKVEPNLLLKKVSPGQINARNVILVNLQNDQKTYINQVAFSAEITKKGHEEVLYKEEKANMQIAPNTNFSVPIALKGQPLKPGDYHLSMTVVGNKDAAGSFKKSINNESISFRNQWQFEKDFTINGEVAKELNEKDVTLKENHSNLYLLIGLLLLLIVILIIAWLIWRKKKQEKNEREI
ncbi:DUF916 and DUF3324 domain-containing protein [Enterococcus faecalis]|uniref:DUF916 and DUF3324 domain-containing protein n=1 Tax=Enterococcus faecalis TaxID=1351 RepID=UPI0015A323AB|nr:DUF916 and DUF3324 domain-containing protein [Enterococcus faecalis]EGO7907947.1 DUF916 and DUF3324 domain-containing protein [Enterococcus faecalis]EGO9137009.1 DUF916 and DUF3324 domain-containing protein [Enterococcus faecalis]MDQ4499395.1 DUF916 and DUF3324 domain-containing protein [Enterococcus faecalis]NVX16668.1 DUF916 and DUF3324 domain-containing protein [Enterococcus faecalis]